nr:PXMP2/4 family protein 2 isoform X2 [Ipomoea batatas]
MDRTGKRTAKCEVVPPLKVQASAAKWVAQASGKNLLENGRFVGERQRLRVPKGTRRRCKKVTSAGKGRLASLPKIGKEQEGQSLTARPTSQSFEHEKDESPNCMAERPLETQVISSGILWAIADVVAQSISISTAKKRLLISGSNKELTMDRKRVGITCMYGIGFFGPLGHFWYKGLDQFIKLRFRLQPNSLQFLATKVAVDILVFGPLNLLLFFTYMGFSMGKSASQVKETIKRDFLPALALEGSVWPLAQAVNFRYVPVQYQLLYVNVFSLLDSAFLSWLEQQQKDPPGNQCYALVPISNDPKDEFK